MNETLMKSKSVRYSAHHLLARGLTDMGDCAMCETGTGLERFYFKFRS